MSHHTTDHGTEEAFCPRCDDYRPGSVTSHELHGVTAWSCLACDWTEERDRVPHDVDESDRLLEEGVITV